MIRARRTLAGWGALAAALTLALACGSARADPMPPGWQAENLQPVGYKALHPGRAFKITLKPANGRC